MSDIAIQNTPPQPPIEAAAPTHVLSTHHAGQPAAVRQTEAHPGHASRVHVHVDRLQIAGLAAHDRQRFVRALERELRGVAFDSKAALQGPSHAVHLPHVSAGRLRANGTPEDAAAQVARQIARQMQPHTGNPPHAREANDA